MSQSTDHNDLETLELYLDRELADGDVARVDARLAGEPALRATLDRLRGQRARRLAAMSTAFDTDAASVERLVASVRAARADEVAATLAPRRGWWLPNPSYFAAAASLAFGLILGVQLQRQQTNPVGGQVATPVASNGGTQVGNASVAIGAGMVRSHGAYLVSVAGPDGRERMKVRLNSAEQCEQFIRMLNQGGAGGVSRNVEVRIVDDPF